MKLLRHIAMAAAVVAASTASAEVISNVYDFEDYSDMEPVVTITDPALRSGDDHKQNNIAANSSGWIYGTILEYEGGKYAYNETRGCIVSTIWNDGANNYGGNINKICQVVDLGGTTGKALAICGASNPEWINNALKSRGIDAKLEGTSNIPQWNLYFFFDPQHNKIQGKSRVTMRLSAVHNKNQASEISTNHLIDHIYARGWGGDIFKDIAPGDNFCQAHDQFRLDDWTELSFVVDPGSNSFEFLQINMQGWGNLGDVVLFIKDIIVERVDSSEAAGTESWGSTFFSVGLGFENANKVMSVGDKDTEIYTPKFQIEGYDVRYSSSDETVATVDEETGEVTPLKFGTAVITAEYINNPYEDYLVGDDENPTVWPTRARYTVFVKDPYIHARTFAYTIDDQLPEYSQFTFTTTGTKWHGGFETVKEDPNDPEVVAGEPIWKGGHCDFSKGSTMEIAMDGRNIIEVEVEGEQLNNFKLNETSWEETTSTNTKKGFKASEAVAGGLFGWGAKPAGDPLHVSWKNEASTYATSGNAIINSITVYYDPLIDDIKIVPVVATDESETANKTLTLPAIHDNFKMQYAVKSNVAPANMIRRAASVEDFTDDMFTDVEGGSHFTKNDDGSFTHNIDQDSEYTLAFRAVNKSNEDEKTDIVLHEVTKDGGETGIDEVTVEVSEDDMPAVYYNLQGVRVNGTPEAGVYIKVKGTTSRKVRF